MEPLYCNQYIGEKNTQPDTASKYEYNYSCTRTHMTVDPW